MTDRAEVARALYLSMVREVFALSEDGRRADSSRDVRGASESRPKDAMTLSSSVRASEVFALSAASSTARPHAESIDGAAVRASALGRAGANASPDAAAPKTSFIAWRSLLNAWSLWREGYHR